jgi:hypothetical protein
MRAALTRAAAAAAALLVLACNGDSPTAPVPGPLRVVLTSPNTDDGAVMFQVVGVVDSVVAAPGLTLYTSVPGPNALRAIVTGTISDGGSLLTLYVPDVARASTISTQVLQVAARATYLERSLTGYHLKAQK